MLLTGEPTPSAALRPSPSGCRIDSAPQRASGLAVPTPRAGPGRRCLAQQRRWPRLLLVLPLLARLLARAGGSSLRSGAEPAAPPPEPEAAAPPGAGLLRPRLRPRSWSQAGSPGPAPRPGPCMATEPRGAPGLPSPNSRLRAPLAPLHRPVQTGTLEPRSSDCQSPGVQAQLSAAPWIPILPDPRTPA